MAKILIVHGLYHSKHRYEKLAEDLTGHQCVVVDLPGFGEGRYYRPSEFIEEEQVEYVRGILRHGKFDFVIAHSWGCRITLQALPDDTTTCIMLNPVYGVNPYLRLTGIERGGTKPLLHLPRLLPKGITSLPIKVASLAAINGWGQIDDIIIEDVQRADPNVAIQVLERMATHPYTTSRQQVKNPIHLIYSDRDRSIHFRCFQEFIRDLQPTCWFFEGKGHTLVLEEYPALLSRIRGIVEG